MRQRIFHHWNRDYGEGLQNNRNRGIRNRSEQPLLAHLSRGETFNGYSEARLVLHLALYPQIGFPYQLGAFKFLRRTRKPQVARF